MKNVVFVFVMALSLAGSAAHAGQNRCEKLEEPDLVDKARNGSRGMMRTCHDLDGNSDIMPILSPFCYLFVPVWIPIAGGLVTYPITGPISAVKRAISGKEVVYDRDGYIKGYCKKEQQADEQTAEKGDAPASEQTETPASNEQAQ